MANLKKTHSISTIFSFFFITIFVSSSNANAVSPTGVIERTVKQQVLASLAPSHEHEPLPQSGSGTSQLFLTSTSGKYTFLLRRETSLGSGGFGNDLCYIQVQEGGQNVWESECASVSNTNTCSLVFSDAGLEIYDGSRLAWDTNTAGDKLETVELLDVGEIQMRDQNGDIAWKASDRPLVNQNCGSVGGPGLLPAQPPFGTPVSGGNLPFTKPVNSQTAQTGFQQQQQQLNYPQQGLNQPLSLVNQPFGVDNQQGLVDNNPFDSGVSIEFNIGVFILSVVISFAVSGLIA
ncbi:hypothetical protein RJ641_028865 [Dillenia turbinata]|uniref:Bulb-type lectin domain-containing protein n=1 Tax=Dillenia turbinata TaxID=194707 RepID=A0AAN8VX30_9MAGN